MGPRQSKATSVIEVINKTLTNVIISNSNSCKSGNSAVQTMKFSDMEFKGCKVDFKDISQDINIKQNFTCVQDSKNQSELATKFKNELENAAKAKIEGIGLSLASQTISEAVSKTINEVVNNINISNVSKCVANQMAAQTQTFEKIKIDCVGLSGEDARITFENISQKIVSEQVAKCIQSNSTVVNVANDLESIIKQEAEAIDEGVKIPDFGMFFIIIILFILGFGFYSFNSLLRNWKAVVAIILSIIIGIKFLS